MVPADRIRVVHAAPLHHDGAYVLYWMTAFRRTRWNFALERAIEHAHALAKPLLVLEAIAADYPWASARFTAFAVSGMGDNNAAFARAGVSYYPYVEPEAGAGKGLLDALARNAAVVVADDYPCFVLPRMLNAFARRSPVQVEAVDANGLLPIAAVERVYPTAYAFRRELQRQLPTHLAASPMSDPLAGYHAGWAAVPEEIASRWPRRQQFAAAGGGAVAGEAQLDRFLSTTFDRYAEEQRHPDLDATSQLSAYLHWGHVSAHDVFARVMRREGWLGQLPRKATGAREGWWGVSASAEAFLDQLVTWRELGFNMTARRPDYDRYESLPEWARHTLDSHADDPREHLYDLETFEQARTHDPLWNACQRQLVDDGRIHTYLRMLWGKKILEWSASPRAALDIMIELNNKYAFDGRDPNSYSGIFWVLGRYDRPWAPERAVFGTVRYMSSTNTARKVKVKQYLTRRASAPLPL